MGAHEGVDSYRNWKKQIPIFQKELTDHVQCLLRLQHTGDPEVFNALGDAFLMGFGIPKDLTEAADRFRVASEAGHTKSMVSLGRILGRGDGKNQLDEARYWYQKAADGGYAGGMVALGFVYREGEGVTVDPAKAAEWFAKAVDAGHKGAKILLAKVYYFSMNATDKALPLLLEEAETENIDSFKILGQIYSDERTNYYDFERAVFWYERVTNGKYSGSANAARMALAELYLSGKRRPKNVSGAKEHLETVVTNSSEKGACRRDAMKLLEKIEKSQV